MVSDVGIYYCSERDYDTTTFGNGIFLIHEDIRTQHVVQQAVSETVQPGDSVTLNCTIHTETCAGEHSVYWFRHGSGESHPGIIYHHGDWSDQCEKSPEAGSPTQSCVYNLPKRNLSPSDAGTYYCAVASCGEILFGDETKLDVEGCLGVVFSPSLLMYCLGVAFGLCVILIIVRLCIKMARREWTYPHPRVPGVPTNSQIKMLTLHYAALNVVHKKRKAGRQRSAMDRDTVYSDMD
ncbi:uncharacterized protein [Salvelinus alpinus]|uniref:uncharacterized protein n=1 Tax=Salvelinus alpinus TaxID=8036 RepID=UPI0039FB8CE9